MTHPTCFALSRGKEWSTQNVDPVKDKKREREREEEKEKILQDPHWTPDRCLSSLYMKNHMSYEDA